jgi:hypothetical protein
MLNHHTRFSLTSCKGIYMKKICKKCEKNKPIEDFGNQPRNKDGKRNDCKKCQSDYAKSRYTQNREKYLEDQKKYQRENKEKVKDSKRRYREKNREKIRAKSSEYSKNNREKINEYYKLKRKNNIQFYISDKVRSRINLALFNKSNSTKELLGCDFDFYIKYLESLFVEGMSWDNRSEWHIDHIKPVCSFDLTNEDQILECFNYKNTQPLWAEDNLKKSGKVVYKV